MKTAISILCLFVVTSIAHAENQGQFLFQQDECQFSGETASTSVEQHFELIKRALNGPELSKYFISCGSFCGDDRYYLDLETPASKKVLSEIRANKKFKNLAMHALLTSKPSDDNYLDVIEVNANWRNDDKVASVLASLLYNPDHEIHSFAAGALKGTTSPVALAKLVKMLDSKNQSVRVFAMTALEGTSDLAARKAAFKLRNDPEFGVRVQAMFVPAP